MFEGPFYRVGHALVSQDGTIVIEHRVVSGDLSHRSRFRLHLLAKPVIEIEQAMHPEEYNEFLALFGSACHLTAVLDQEWQSKLRQWAAQEAELAKERERRR